MEQKAPLNLIYATTPKKDTLRAPALEILAKRGGLLSSKDIIPRFSSFSKLEKWWAIEALENIPSEAGFSLLLDETQSDNWERRLHAAYILGKLRAPPSPLLENLLKDNVKEVRLAAGWALSHHKKELPQELAEYFKRYPSSDIDRHLSTLSQSCLKSFAQALSFIEESKGRV